MITEQVWATTDGSADSGVTLFNGRGDEENDLLEILAVVEEHHDAYSHTPPVSIIEVFATGAAEAVREEFASFGFARFEPTPDGFVAYRETLSS